MAGLSGSSPWKEGRQRGGIVKCDAPRGYPAEGSGEKALSFDPVLTLYGTPTVGRSLSLGSLSHEM